MADNRTRIPVLKVRSKCTSKQQLAVQFRKDLDPRGIFIKTKKGPGVGTALRFEYLLETGEAVIGGNGKVAWTRAAAGDEGPAGIAVEIVSLYLGEALLQRAAEERRGNPSRFDRSVARRSLAPGVGPSMRPTAPPPELEITRITLPPDDEITAVGPRPAVPDSGAPSAALAATAKGSFGAPAAPERAPGDIPADMPAELDHGIFDGVGPVEQDVADEYLSEDLSDSIQAPLRETPGVAPPVAESGPPLSLPERRADWLGPAVGVLLAIFVALAAYLAIVGDELPESIRELLFSM